MTMRMEATQRNEERGDAHKIALDCKRSISVHGARFVRMTDILAVVGLRYVLSCTKTPARRP